MAAAAAARAYDLVVWGGSGFTGRLAAEYLAKRYTPGSPDPNSKGSSEPVRWAIAGRDRVKLESVRESIEAKHPHAKGKIDILIGTNDDPASLESVACVANTVLSFAGPFAICGAPIVDAGCVRLGSHSHSDAHELYRDEGELAEARARDPLPRFRRALLDGGLLPADA